MTIKDREDAIRHLVESIARKGVTAFSTGSVDFAISALVSMTDRWEQDAVAEEREACAQEVEAHDGVHAAPIIAAAIRARGGK